MIYTSYFANWRKFPQGKKLVSIANFPPKGFKGDRYEALFPDKSMFFQYKDGEIDEETFKVLYRNQLDKLDREQILQDLDECILLCYEKSSDFCHRHIVREWLGEKNIQELKGNKQ